MWRGLTHHQSWGIPLALEWCIWPVPQSPGCCLCGGGTCLLGNFPLLSLGYTFHTPVGSGHAQWACHSPYKVLSFSYSFRPDEVHSSGWKLVFHESTVLFQRKSTSTITTTEWEIYINLTLLLIQHMGSIKQMAIIPICTQPLMNPINEMSLCSEKDKYIVPKSEHFLPHVRD